MNLIKKNITKVKQSATLVINEKSKQLIADGKSLQLWLRTVAISSS